MPGTERVALVHDRLDQDGGAERVLEVLHSMFPTAPIYTAIWNQRKVPRFSGCDVRVTWMQRLPGVEEQPRLYAALYPLAFAQLDLREFDVVISHTTSFAAGVHTRGDTLHVCYCHSPSNFVWRPHAYFTRRASRLLTAPLRAWLKAWDRHAGAQPDLFVTNGKPVAERIQACYGRDAAVIPSPIDGFWFTQHRADEFYLVAGRLVEQKRVDLAIEACARLGLPLVVVGTGRAAAELQRLAGPGTRFLGRVSDQELRSLYARARALILPAEEDFGLVPLEAQAAGTPVVAYDAGGARETVVDGSTGIRFRPQTVEGLAAAIERSARLNWDRARIQAQAARFDEASFRHRMHRFIDESLERARSSAGRPLRSPHHVGWRPEL
jgi:glycosyltransferase involved in cell wall biosynthesis